jgi:hypothetical protein
MKTSIRMAAWALAGLMPWGAVTLAQAQGKPADCPRPGAAEKVEGQVLKVDPSRGTLTVRAPDGTTHEFHASKETLQDMKVGDKIQAKLRVSENCKKS